MRCSYLHFCI